MILYGHPMTRTIRPLWLLHELDVPFEHVPTHYATGDTQKPEFLAINPNGHVPALVDGDVKLFESMAINLYLARKYDGGLWPKSIADEGRAYQWSFWGMTEIEEPLLTWLTNTVVRPEPQRDAAKAADAKQRLEKPLGVLEAALRGRPYLLGPSFSIADLNLASILVWARMGRLDLSRWPWVDAWLARCLERPAAKKASGRG